MFVWPYIRSHILCMQLVICLSSHFIHIWYLDWPWSDGIICACSDHGQSRYQIWIKCNKRQMTSCVHKMCKRTYGQTNMKWAITLAKMWWYALIAQVVVNPTTIWSWPQWPLNNVWFLENISLKTKFKFVYTPTRRLVVMLEYPCTWLGVFDITFCDQVYQWHAQVCGFLQVLWFPLPIKLTATI
jgi:hypothetical protein